MELRIDQVLPRREAEKTSTCRGCERSPQHEVAEGVLSMSARSVYEPIDYEQVSRHRGISARSWLSFSASSDESREEESRWT